MTVAIIQRHLAQFDHAFNNLRGVVERCNGLGVRFVESNQAGSQIQRLDTVLDTVTDSWDEAVMADYELSGVHSALNEQRDESRAQLQNARELYGELSAGMQALSNSLEQATELLSGLDESNEALGASLAERRDQVAELFQIAFAMDHCSLAAELTILRADIEEKAHGKIDDAINFNVQTQKAINTGAALENALRQQLQSHHETGIAPRHATLEVLQRKMQGTANFNERELAGALTNLLGEVQSQWQTCVTALEIFEQKAPSIEMNQIREDLVLSITRAKQSMQVTRDYFSALYQDIRHQLQILARAVEQTRGNLQTLGEYAQSIPMTPATPGAPGATRTMSRTTSAEAIAALSGTATRLNFDEAPADTDNTAQEQATRDAVSTRVAIETGMPATTTNGNQDDSQLEDTSKVSPRS